MSAKRNTKKD